MNAQDYVGLLPLLIITATSIVVMLVAAFNRDHLTAAILSAIGIVAAFVSLWSVSAVIPRQVTPLLIIDLYFIFFAGLILAATLAVLVLSYSYLERFDGDREEFYIVLLVAALGSCVIVASSHFVSFFLGLELLTVSLYGMIAYLRTRERSLEAGVKYLVLAGASSGFLLFGMALLYAEFGTMEFGRLASAISVSAHANTITVLAGLSMMIVGIGFKLAVVPFHMWTPDVYEGAPAPVTAFVATVSKGAMMALLIRFFFGIKAPQFESAVTVFSIIATASMFLGNLLALLQSNVKRILAYSSIAHLGYMLVAFVAGQRLDSSSGALAIEAISYYLVVYFVTTLAVFGIVSILSVGGDERDDLISYRGLFWEKPWMAGIFTAALLSLAGIPLTAGFVGKYLVVMAGVGALQWTLVIILVINSAIGLYYYLRIVVVMLAQSGKVQETPARVPVGGRIVLAILGVGILLLGIYPAPLMQVIASTVTAFLP